MSLTDRAQALRKPRPKLLDKREAKAKVNAEDRAENAKVKARSKGQCEIRVCTWEPWQGLESITNWRCLRHAAHIHHLISGIGRRNIGDSIKASAKLHVCDRHHAEIHGHVLKPANELDRYDAATVRYERRT